MSFHRVEDLLASLRRPPVTVDLKQALRNLTVDELRELSARIIGGNITLPPVEPRIVDDAEWEDLYEEACLVASDLCGVPMYGAPVRKVFEICWGQQMADQLFRERETYLKHSRG